MTLKLVIFDVVGTLIDSQAHIVGAMNAAFGGLGLTPPTREQTLSIVGLSLPVAIDRLMPETVTLYERGDLSGAVLYVVASVTCSIFGLLLGLWLARGIFV